MDRMIPGMIINNVRLLYTEKNILDPPNNTPKLHAAIWDAAKTRLFAYICYFECFVYYRNLKVVRFCDIDILAYLPE